MRGSDSLLHLKRYRPRRNPPQLVLGSTRTTNTLSSRSSKAQPSGSAKALRKPASRAQSTSKGCRRLCYLLAPNGSKTFLLPRLARKRRRPPASQNSSVLWPSSIKREASRAFQVTLSRSGGTQDPSVPTPDLEFCPLITTPIVPW